jgi:hypothetical protein
MPSIEGAARGYNTYMPRNVVTVSPKWFPPLPRLRRERERILREVSSRRQPSSRGRATDVRFDFSRREDRSVARGEVVAWLEQINPKWQRYVRVYPLSPDGSGVAQKLFWVFATVGIWIIGVAAILAAIVYVIIRLV